MSKRFSAFSWSRDVFFCALFCLLLPLGLSSNTGGQDALSPPLHPEANPSAPAKFSKQTIEGWTVQLDQQLLEGKGKAIGDKAQRLLANKLFEIQLRLPADRLKKLQQVVIFLELKNPKLKPMQYHPSAAWLKQNGQDPQMAKAVHIPDAGQFISPSFCHTQPWAVLHELAHAYHHQVLSFENAEIKTAYARYLELAPKGDVLHISGKLRPHYARTNEKEFFAEFTESYFGTNDFYPFVAGELKKEFPHVYELMQEIWGPLP
jgi:hypothetical protein